VLEIRAGIATIGRVRISIIYQILRDGEVVADGETEHALLDDAGKPQRLPAEIRTLVTGPDELTPLAPAGGAREP
jgi:acyl-CoA thioesterase FadM